jgi:phage baseplate assembly protein W
MVWWKDIDIELDRKNDGDIKDFTDEEAIKQSLKNIFSTLQGQRRRLPTFATNLYFLLFDPVDDITAREIGENILSAITTWEDRITVDDILVKPSPDDHRYDITVSYFIRGVISPQRFSLEETIQAA